MNDTDLFFKEVFEYEYGYIEEDIRNEEIFKLNVTSNEFWDKSEEILNSNDFWNRFSLDVFWNRYSLDRYKFFYISAEYIFKDNIISEEEYLFLSKLMKVLKVSKYEIYNKFKTRIDKLTYELFYLMFLDNVYTDNEEKEMIHLSEILGIEYLVMCDIKRAVFNDKYKNSLEEETKKNRHIPEAVIMEVYKRDDGRCVICGSSEDIEYDHIIPFSKGGSNSVNNIRVLCRSCNRKKSNNIGLIE